MIHCMSFLAAFKVGAWLHKLKGWWRCARFVVQGKLVGFILFFQNIALLFLPQERILVNRFGSRGLSKFVLETWLRNCIDREGLGRRAKLYPFIECFQMTSRRPYWCPKTMKRRPCWCPKPVLWELNSFLMQTLSFVPINLHICWPREWKHSIQMGGANVMWVHYIREVSNNDGDGLLRKRHLKSRAASNFIALIPSRLIRQMLAIFFWRWILTDCVKILEKKKKVVVLCVHPQKNVKLGIFTS